MLLLLLFSRCIHGGVALERALSNLPPPPPANPPHSRRACVSQDVARLAVTRQIASMVQENYAALVGGMRQVQAVDLDLARAGVQVGGEKSERV